MLVGIVSLPVDAARIGVLIVVGGPQYRVGSHRQFVSLARTLAEAGVACMRFDYRGMGDSEGDRTPFDATQPDIAAAVSAFRGRVPGLATVVTWGLCDGATACALASLDTLVGGMVLLNPWVHDETTAAQATLRHYYTRRFLAADFWRKLGSGRLNPIASANALLHNVRRAVNFTGSGAVLRSGGGLAERVALGVAAHRGPVLIMLSGNDQTAAEFKLAAQKAGPLRTVMGRENVARVEMAEADHTLSVPYWRDRAGAITVDWLRSRFAPLFTVVP